MTANRKTRTREEFLRELLPVWEVEKAKWNGNTVFKIVCPYKDCGQTAVVSRKWTKPRMVSGPHNVEVMIVGRSCPYCHKTAQVPPEYPGGKFTI